MAAQSLGKALVAKRRASVYGKWVLRVLYAVFVCNLLALVGLSLTLGDQVAKAAAYVDAPGVRTDGVALIRGNEAYVRKSNLCFAVFLGHFKDNVGILPLVLVLYEVKVVVCNVPNNLFTWNKIGDLDGAAVNILVVVLKFTEFVGSALNFLRPPSADVIDGGEDFFGALVYLKISAVTLIHASYLPSLIVDYKPSINFVLAICKYKVAKRKHELYNHSHEKATFHSLSNRICARHMG